MDFRVETDSMGEVQVPSDALWGAQTQRSLTHFHISEERFSWPFIESMIKLKKAVAQTNQRLKKLDQPSFQLIADACDKLLAERDLSQFPLYVWQTGSGTQTNMNVNEVIANQANLLAGAPLGQRQPIHPNDHVNMSQSSNDVFPTAMHLTLIAMCDHQLLMELTALIRCLTEKSSEFKGITMVGRTHWMDAVSLQVNEFLSGFIQQLEDVQLELVNGREKLTQLAIGGSAVGNAVNVPDGFNQEVASSIQQIFGFKVNSSSNKFSALSAQDQILFFHSQLKQLATVLFKLANDIRYLSSGPNAGIGEWQLPENEPGSSIMPGKVNPTQCEALTMACVQVFANDVAVSFGGASGHMQLNVYRPMIIHNAMQSLRLLTDSMSAFRQYALQDIALNQQIIADRVEKNLMDITRYAPLIGYDNAAKVVHLAKEERCSLKEAASRLGIALE